MTETTLQQGAKTAGSEWIVKGDTDCVAELQDRMNYASWYPGVYKSGYWIDEDKTNGGHDVKSADTPYVLFEANKAAVVINAGNPVTYTSKASAIFETTNKDKEHPAGCGCSNNYHYLLFNTKGTDGSVANLDAGQCWKTKAKGAGTNGGNGVGADNATKAQEAYFSDGKYIINAKAWDLIGVTDTTHAVYVENFPPAVKAKAPVGGYENCGTIAVASNITITFSEPMNKTATEAAVSIKKKSDGSTVSFSTSWNSGDYVLTCDPANDLAYNTEYEVTVTTAAKDPYGGASFNGLALDSEFGSTNHNGTGGESGDSVTWTFWTVPQ